MTKSVCLIYVDIHHIDKDIYRITPVYVHRAIDMSTNICVQV